MNELEKYFQIVEKIRNQQDIDRADLDFFWSYSPKIDETKIQKLVDGGTLPSSEEARQALIEAGRQMQSSPKYKDYLLNVAKDAEKGKLSSEISNGINLVLAGSNIAQSINQIQTAKREQHQSKKPGRPATPGRDQQLAAALRRSQEIINDPARALAPVQAEIQDQYQQDIANARTASTGQAGAFGSYAQVAADRRNRAALGLAPIQDQIRRGAEANQQALIGMRMDETQRMYDNNARFYNTDLDQYNQEQQAAGALQAQGYRNLNNSLYGFGQQAAPAAAKYATERKYRDIRNRAAAAHGPDVAETMVRAQQLVDQGYDSGRPLPYINTDMWIDNPLSGESRRMRIQPGNQRYRAR